MTDKLKAELEQIAAASPDGLLHPESVVEFAKNPETALYGEFNWDDAEAANLYRVDQARSIIRLHVKYAESVHRNVRAYVSVPSDRPAGGGYRNVEQVLARPDLQLQFVEEIRSKLRSMQQSYTFITMLDSLWPRLIAATDQYLAEESAEKKAG